MSSRLLGEDWSSIVISSSCPSLAGYFSADRDRSADTSILDGALFVASVNFSDGAADCASDAAPEGAHRQYG